jgi:hypothetical protein
MKYPIHRAKGPKHISVNQLDTGTILGSDWRSAEKEARFMENWGRAGRWTDPELAARKTQKSKNNGFPLLSEDRYADRDGDEIAEAQEKQEEGKLWMPDVNSMSRKEFDRYLETIRRDGGKFLPTKLALLQESRGKRAVESDSTATMVGIASRGQTSPSDSAHFQATLTHEEMTTQGSTKLHSAPHKMHGLTYSTTSASSSVVPGHVLHRSKDGADGPGYYRPRMTSEGANQPWIVSVGGLTGQLPNAQLVRDNRNIKAVDYTRENPEQGRGSFEIRKAHLKTPATVQNLQSSTQAARWAGRRGRFGSSGAKQPSPLDTFTFDIELGHDKGARAEVVPGSKEWVGRDTTRRASGVSAEDRNGLGLGVGGPKSDRVPGGAQARLAELTIRQAREARRKTNEVQNNIASNLVERLRKMNQPSTEDKK